MQWQYCDIDLYLGIDLRYLVCRDDDIVSGAVGHGDHGLHVQFLRRVEQRGVARPELN